MIIVIPIQDVYELFPETKGDFEKLEKSISAFYTIGATKPKIEIKEEVVTIVLDIERIGFEQTNFNKLLRLCENSKFEQAEIYAKELIRQYPAASEYYRILGQVQAETGNYEEAINSLIDALRWDPKNIWALLMMGNVFSQYKNDIDTALTYYNQILEIKPDDNITLNNIGANLIQAGKIDEAVRYFHKAVVADPDYPNTYLGLGLVSEKKERYEDAFEYALKAIEKSRRGNEVYNKSIHLALDCSKILMGHRKTDEVVVKFLNDLTEKTGAEIKIEEDSTIPTAAKIEYAQNYRRDYHLIKFKSGYPAVSHLIVHELMHLELSEEAKKEGGNYLFTSNQTHKAKFLQSFEREGRKLRKKGIPKESVNNFLSTLFDGINSQMFNTPIDLFIEDRIYKRFKDLRPIQFLSLINLIKEGIKATTNKDVLDNAPKGIISKSKILNLVNALHLNDLYHVDLLPEFKATKVELRQAKELYNEFREYRNDKEPGEEYELIQHWGEDLNLESYFELIPESKRKQKSVDTVLDNINKDPYGLEEEDVTKERKMKRFLKENSSEDLNMAVVMYMVDALNFFKGKPKETIKKIAFEFATLGMTGIDPNKNNYSVPSIKDSSFSGYKTLAYYYVSWAMAIPEMVNSLQMPFEKEYSMARKFLKE